MMKRVLQCKKGKKLKKYNPAKQAQCIAPTPKRSKRLMPNIGNQSPMEKSLLQVVPIEPMVIDVYRPKNICQVGNYNMHTHLLLWLFILNSLTALFLRFLSVDFFSTAHGKCPMNPSDKQSYGQTNILPMVN